MLFIRPVVAQCPICIVTVGGGLVIAKKLGIDDLLVSLWISGLNTAIAFWITTKIKTKILNHPLLWSLTFYAFTLIYLLISKQIGHRGNTFLGIDKVVFGMTAGLFIFCLGILIDRLIRLKNKGKVLFYYQKVILPVGMLLLGTGILKLFL
jgi:hypothetical protein